MLGNYPTQPYQNDIFESLNPEQKLAVQTTNGALLVLAGAGTGKTRVLTTRLGHILASGDAFPYQILAVTFTNKSANEMRERVAKIVGKATEGLWLGTFHSLSLRIVRRHGDRLGIRPDFTILDSDDQQRLLKQILQAQGIDDKKNPPRLVAAIINRWKDRGLTPAKVTRTEAKSSFLILEVYKEYQQRLLVLNAVDFGDLLLHCLTLFTDFPDVLAVYQQQFKYIMVDEYQDTNIAQYLWLRMLTMNNQNICCVGDDDQSIYAWRGAEIGNILRFEQDFHNATVVRLEQNYRSTPHILAVASNLIQNNTGRLGKKLWTEFPTGEKVLIRGTWDCDEEARFIGEEIEDRQRRGQSLSNMAILVRAGFQTREFEDRFLILGVPYRVIGGLRFYERQEIRDAIAYIRLVIQPDDGLAFERIINMPRRGIGHATLQLIHKEAREAGLSLSRTAFELCNSELIRSGVRTTLRGFFTNLERWRQLLREKDHAEIVQIILDESGYTEMWMQDKSADAPGRLENLKELISAIRGFESLQDFLEHVSLVMDNTKQSHEEMISIMTLHAAKGLEFEVVFLPGWEEGLFPHPRSLDESGNEGLEEERRLAYVGITRAKKAAIITYSLRRRSYGGWQNATYSRFVKELPHDHIIHLQANGAEVAMPNDGTAVANSKSSAFLKKSVNFFKTIPFKNNVFEAEYVDEPKHSLKPDERVFHQKFGYGIIRSVNNEQLEINFETSGIKTIMANFVKKG